MSAVIIEHVNVAELPDAWRARLPVPRAVLVTDGSKPRTPPSLGLPVFFHRSPAVGAVNR